MRYKVGEFDPEQHTGPLPSPCLGICKINPRNRQCDGCFRTIEEICNWADASEQQKLAVWRELKHRAGGR